MARDVEAEANLQKLGWQVHVVWECETKDLARLREVLARGLSRAAAALARGHHVTLAKVRKLPRQPLRFCRMAAHAAPPARPRIQVRRRGMKP